MCMGRPYAGRRVLQACRAHRYAGRRVLHPCRARRYAHRRRLQTCRTDPYASGCALHACRQRRHPYGCAVHVCRELPRAYGWSLQPWRGLLHGEGSALHVCRRDLYAGKRRSEACTGPPRAGRGPVGGRSAVLPKMQTWVVEQPGVAGVGPGPVRISVCRPGWDGNILRITSNVVRWTPPFQRYLGAWCAVRYGCYEPWKEESSD